MASMKSFATIIALFLMLGGNALADCKLKDFIPDHYRITGPNKKGNIISASTSSTTSSVTYGFAKMSSTSGCGRRGRAHLMQEHFLLKNRIYLMADISRGGGEYLSSFSQLMGCSTEVQDQLTQTLQGKLDQLMPAEPLPAKAVLTQIHRISNAQPMISKGCLYTG